MSEETIDISWSRKVDAFSDVARFRPIYVASIVIISTFAAALEGFGLSFILPIVEVAQSDGIDPAEADGLLGIFLWVYNFFGVPFTIEFLVGGVTVVMIVRFSLNFVVEWFQGALETKYVSHLQREALDSALSTEITHFDEEGSDDIINAIVTQAEYGGLVIRHSVEVLKQSLLALMYFGIALYLAPILSLLTVLVLGGIMLLFQNVVEEGFSLGDDVADAKERIQEHAQAGTQGIRDVKLYGLTNEIYTDFSDAVGQFERSRIKLRMNKAAINNFYQLMTALTVFGLIYLAITTSSLSIGGMGVFLFAMFRLGPRASRINKQVYSTEGQLPHLIRTQDFISTLNESSEPDTSGTSVPDDIHSMTFSEVSFSYPSTDEPVLSDVSFSVEKDDFVAFVGSSGAGKSTIVSLVARMYEPDSGEITANDTPISTFDLREWRSKIAFVRQDPYIFNWSLRRNITIGRRNATQDEIERVCEIAQVTEFIDSLPNGYDTILGDEGVKLSGGQRQRVAIARALLKDSDLLILDEATSDLDTTIENDVHTAIESMDREYAILVVAHRLSTVKSADCIHTIENGEIIESGKHSELLDRRGKYAELYSAQG